MPCLNSLPAWPIDRASLGSLDAPNMRSRMSRTMISSPPPRLGILYLRSSAVAGGRGYLHSHEFHVLFVRNLERKSADRDHYLFHPDLGQASDPVRPTIMYAPTARRRLSGARPAASQARSATSARCR